jgi:hypothetical protein
MAGTGESLSDSPETQVNTAAGSILLKGQLHTLVHTHQGQGFELSTVEEKILVSAAQYLNDNEFHAAINGQGGTIRNSKGKEVHRLKVVNGIYYLNPTLYDQQNKHCSLLAEHSFLQFLSTPSIAGYSLAGVALQVGTSVCEAISKLINSPFKRPREATCLSCLKGVLVERNFSIAHYSPRPRVCWESLE